MNFALVRTGVMTLGIGVSALSGQLPPLQAAQSQGAQTGRAPVPWFDVGEAMPVLTGVDLDGQLVNVDFRGRTRPTVLYYITPYGHFVAQNENAFSSLVKQRSAEYDFIVASGRDERLAEYAASQRASWGSTRVLVVGGIAGEAKLRIRMGAYPMTLVVSTKGLVDLLIPGTYQNNQSVVQRFFGIRPE